MKKIVWLFPGQGSQYVGMGKKLAEQFHAVREVFEEANDVMGFDLKRLCFEGSMDELTRTENTQPAILTVSVAACRVYMQEIGIEPYYCAGHSLGEISALTCAYAIEFHDALKIVRRRGELMKEAAAAGLGSMAAVSGIDKAELQKICDRYTFRENVAVISNYNSPDQTVISGHKAAIYEINEHLQGLGAKVVPLKVSAPFHSPLMQKAADKFEMELAGYKFGDLKYPVISNTNALPYEGKASIASLLKAQITRPVQWVESMEYLRQHEMEIAVELGPGTVLRNLMSKNTPGIKTFSFDKEDDTEELKKVLSENQISFENQIKRFEHTVVTKCIAVAVCTRNRNWNYDEYLRGVIEPYKKVQKRQEELEKEGIQPTLFDMQEALDMLSSVFVTKKVPVKECIERFNEVFHETGTRHLFPDFKMQYKDEL
ncbi:ACP S-malonyltransferase [Pseudobacteroides cellulosolvens]|uniref:[acyl-carrier-protein] S-malonyltransferase n=1 Tax=Pseudobacteroides cellulosolvens ATCC 35603 = DSM 2933 TaxID=398512 RepID=A0A0L6JGX9_9FIRM|nr:ACP S-malonyltransferase [Pseudobacteroides cellulosolvens]KNY24965.1 malonyl CoA-acyl carrier protein transacylase [Pseudobacteroides cellulosolvens ATCC 35603 = DSM 2933]